MRIFELEQPKSAEQFKLDQLQAVNKRASLAVKNEREKQKLQHANKALQQLHKPKAATVVPKKNYQTHQAYTTNQTKQIAIKKAATVDGLKK